jgi:hypothetical protein
MVPLALSTEWQECLACVVISVKVVISHLRLCQKQMESVRVCACVEPCCQACPGPPLLEGPRPLGGNSRSEPGMNDEKEGGFT